MSLGLSPEGCPKQDKEVFLKKSDKITFLKADFFTHIILQKYAIFTKLWDSCGFFLLFITVKLKKSKYVLNYCYGLTFFRKREGFMIYGKIRKKSISSK